LVRFPLVQALHDDVVLVVEPTRIELPEPALARTNSSAVASRHGTRLPVSQVSTLHGAVAGAVRRKRTHRGQSRQGDAYIARRSASSVPTRVPAGSRSSPASRARAGALAPALICASIGGGSAELSNLDGIDVLTERGGLAVAEGPNVGCLHRGRRSGVLVLP
jgi:hypothetical protein